jgi:hypothetical protein
MEVFRTKPTILECHVNDPNAPVIWYKNGIPIDVSLLTRANRIERVRIFDEWHRQTRDGTGWFLKPH